jgi:hypothetical protein
MEVLERQQKTSACCTHTEVKKGILPQINRSATEGAPLVEGRKVVHSGSGCGHGLSLSCLTGQALKGVGDIGLEPMTSRM